MEKEENKNNSNKDFSDYNLLIIDDEESYRKYLATIAEKSFDLNVILAQNPKEAFDYMNNEQIPDIIMLDMQMPIMDGQTALKFIRSNSRTKNIPVLICTALSSETLLISLFKLGISDYIIKPSDTKSIAKKILKAIKESDKFKTQQSNESNN